MCTTPPRSVIMPCRLGRQIGLVPSSAAFSSSLACRKLLRGVSGVTTVEYSRQSLAAPQAHCERHPRRWWSLLHRAPSAWNDAAVLVSGGRACLRAYRSCWSLHSFTVRFSSSFKRARNTRISAGIPRRVSRSGFLSIAVVAVVVCWSAPVAAVSFSSAADVSRLGILTGLRCSQLTLRALIVAGGRRPGRSLVGDVRP